MDIYIKSFNRPYFLDRCIYSIYKQLKNFKGRIIVLDDGTPEKFLKKIIQKYPNITIKKSNFYDEKSTNIILKTKANSNKIPIDFWLNEVRNASEFFLLLEDDIWFSSSLDMNEIIYLFNEFKIPLLKLIWLGNNKLIEGEEEKTIENNFIQYLPKIYVKNPFLFKLIFNTNRFGIGRLMRLTRIQTLDKYLNYYGLYAVAGAIFEKKYFLELWNGHKNEVDERLQLLNALIYFKKNDRIDVFRSKNEILKTSFLSSATNKKMGDLEIEIDELNRILNESWYNGLLETDLFLEKDLDIDLIGTLLEKENNSKITRENWEKWVLSFKNQFRKIGCKIE